MVIENKVQIAFERWKELSDITSQSSQLEGGRFKNSEQAVEPMCLSQWDQWDQYRKLVSTCTTSGSIYANCGFWHRHLSKNVNTPKPYKIQHLGCFMLNERKNQGKSSTIAKLESSMYRSDIDENPRSQTHTHTQKTRTQQSRSQMIVSPNFFWTYTR